jgi:hypothetical protein
MRGSQPRSSGCYGGLNSGVFDATDATDAAMNVDLA